MATPLGVRRLNLRPALPPFSSNSETAQPECVVNGSRSGEHGLSGLRLYHHPLCFDPVDTASPQQRARALASHLETMEATGLSTAPPLRLQENIKGAAHHLDATFACPRRYWLEHVRGWSTEPSISPAFDGSTSGEHGRSPRPSV